MVNDIFVMVVIFLFVITLLTVSQASTQWPNHDISTLKTLANSAQTWREISDGVQA